jgi:uncharacterized protein YegP (UPF0339 family)
VEESKAKFELYKGRDDKFYWRLRHRTQDIIADSGQGYTSKANAINGIESVKENAPGAPIIDNTK